MTIRLEFTTLNSTDHVRVMSGNVILGYLHWREWPSGQGYQFHPWNSARRASRVLRDDLFDALTKSARIRAADARAALAEVGLA